MYFSALALHTDQNTEGILKQGLDLPKPKIRFWTKGPGFAIPTCDNTGVTLDINMVRQDVNWPTGNGDAKRKQRFLANMFSLTTYYFNCSLMLRVCNLWQFRHYLFFSFYLLCLFFSCLLPINLVNKDN